jgi:MazG family protein
MTQLKYDPASLAGIHRLLEIMAQLRDPVAGCPWDREQTFASVAPYTIEEAYEVADAIERRDMDALCDELGDLLLQVVFHAEMAREAGAFGFDDVIKAIVDKLLRRHPHVFGEERLDSAQAQTQAWEAHKAAERAAAGKPASASRMDAISRGQPAVRRAHKLQQRAAGVGFDWGSPVQVLGKLEEELAELVAEVRADADRGHVTAELGDVLFTCINLARHLGVDAEAALQHANRKFEDRFRVMEAVAETECRPLSACPPEELERLWHTAKAREQDRGIVEAPPRDGAAES